MLKRLSVENFFLFVSLIFGLIYVFLLPPFQSVDEASHFYRGYEIVSSKFIPQKVNGQVGDYLPESLEKLASSYNFLIKNVDKHIDLKYIADSSSIKLNKDKTKFINFQNTALYSPVCYLTQIPGMYIAKLFDTNPLWIFYAGRISNLLFFTLIVYFSIRIIPFYKLPMMLLAIMPMTLSLAGALTSDVMVIGFNFLWIALLLKFLLDKKPIGNLDICALILIALILALSKDYFLLIPLIFLLPKSRFKSGGYFTCVIGTVLLATAGLLLWQNVVNGIYTDLNSNANALKQWNFILQNPLNYLTVMLNTLIVKTPRIIITMIGVLGWQDTRLDFITYFLYPVLIFMAIVGEGKNKFEFEFWQYCLILADVIFSVCLIFTTMYLMWSKVGASIIFGLNGKYFTPLVMPILLLLYNNIKIDIKDKDTLKMLIFLAVILILISSDLSLIYRFFGLTPNLYYKV